MGVGSSQGEEPENCLLMEDASLASALGLPSQAGAHSAQRLVELSVVALASELHGSPEVDRLDIWYRQSADRIPFSQLIFPNS